MSIDDKLISRLRKLLALAERGVGGEKDTAQRMLDNLLAKNNLTYEDISGDKRTEHWFRFGQKNIHKRLMHQIISSVVGNRDRYKVNIDRSVVIVEATAYEIAEIEMKFSIYKAALDRELEEIFIAFIHKHELFAPSNPDDEQPERDDSPEAKAERKRLIAKILAMRDVNINQALEHKG